MRFITLTGNLLAETTYTFDRWEAGATQRAREETFQVGGKGINVTRMLTRMGVDSIALCFPGGEVGSRCMRWMHARGIPHETFWVAAETRTGAVVRAPDRTETTFLGCENVIDGSAIAACALWLDAQSDGELLSIGGSLPGWTGAAWEPLRTTLDRWASRGLLVVDTYGPPLAWFAKRPAALVKINRREFAGLAGVAVADATDQRMPDLLARVVAQSQIARWVITDGPNPVWSADGAGRIASTPPPAVAEVSPTGSGDVFLAGLLHAMYVRSVDLATAVNLALPLGAANAASPGVAEFDLRPFGF